MVGVIASLALTFAITTLFSEVRLAEGVRGPIPVPVLSSVVWFAVAVSAAGFVAMRWLKASVVHVVFASAAAGFVWNGLL